MAAAANSYRPEDLSGRKVKFILAGDEIVGDVEPDSGPPHRTLVVTWNDGQKKQLTIERSTIVEVLDASEAVSVPPLPEALP